MKEMKVTLVGCGAVTNLHYKDPLRKLHRNGILNVVGLVDNNLEHARRLQRYFPKASIYENVAEAIGDTGSNLTIVASPAALHAEHAVAALKMGNHVLCEKPMAITRAQCTEMIGAARKSGRLLAIGMIRRFFPSFAQVKNLIINGELGDILSFSYREGRKYNWPAMTVASFQRRQTGGGVLFDIGSHVLDTMNCLFGTSSIVSYFDDAIGDGVELNCLIQIKTPFSAGGIYLSWDHYLNNEFCITGTKAEVIVKLGDINTLAMKKSGRYETVVPKITFPKTISKVKPERETPKNIIACVYLQIIQLVRAIKLGEDLPVSAEECATVISLVEGCYSTAMPIDMTWLPSGQNETYKRLHWRNTKWTQ